VHASSTLTMLCAPSAVRTRSRISAPDCGRGTNDEWMRGDSFFGTGTAYNVGASHIREKLGDFVRTTLGDGGSSIGTVFLESSGRSRSSIS